MRDSEKYAFRRMLADAVIYIRAWSNPGLQRSDKTDFTSVLKLLNAIADLFHNVALCSAEDFVGFRPNLFWQQFEFYRRNIPDFMDFKADYERYLREQS
jgi:hypothetical protein